MVGGKGDVGETDSVLALHQPARLCSNRKRFRLLGFPDMDCPSCYSVQSTGNEVGCLTRSRANDWYGRTEAMAEQIQMRAWMRKKATQTGGMLSQSGEVLMRSSHCRAFQSVQRTNSDIHVNEPARRTSFHFCNHNHVRGSEKTGQGHSSNHQQDTTSQCQE